MHGKKNDRGAIKAPPPPPMGLGLTPLFFEGGGGLNYIVEKPSLQ